MSRPVTKCRREITLDSLIAADSSSFSVRCFSRVRSSVRSRRYRVCSRITRYSGVATKQAVTAPRSKHAASHRESDGSRFGRPGRFLTCLASASTHSNPSASSRQNGPSCNPRSPPSPLRAPASTAASPPAPAPPASWSEAAGLARPPPGCYLMAPGSSPPSGPCRYRCRTPCPGTAARRSPLPRVLTCPSRTAHLPGGTARGTGGERRNLTRVLEATMNSPSGNRLPAPD